MAEGGTSSSGIPDDMLAVIGCPICFEVMSTPKSLPCGHTVCADCLLRIVTSIPGKKNQMPCPSCRQNIVLPSGGVADLPTNFAVIGMKEMVLRNAGIRNAEGDKDNSGNEFQEEHIDSHSALIKQRVDEDIEKYSTAIVKLTTIDDAITSNAVVVENSINEQVERLVQKIKNQGEELKTMTRQETDRSKDKISKKLVEYQNTKDKLRECQLDVNKYKVLASQTALFDEKDLIEENKIKFHKVDNMTVGIVLPQDVPLPMPIDSNSPAAIQDPNIATLKSPRGAISTKLKLSLANALSWTCTFLPSGNFVMYGTVIKKLCLMNLAGQKQCVSPYTMKEPRSIKYHHVWKAVVVTHGWGSQDVTLVNPDDLSFKAKVTAAQIKGCSVITELPGGKFVIGFQDHITIHNLKGHMLREIHVGKVKDISTLNDHKIIATFWDKPGCRVYHVDGGLMQDISETLSTRCGVDVDSNGNIWVADHFNNRVSVYNPYGQLLVRNVIHIHEPQTIAVSNGMVAVTNTHNSLCLFSIKTNDNPSSPRDTRAV